MMRIAKIVLVLATVAVLAWSQTPAAKKDNRPPARKGPLTEQWVSLFNGKDLTGWVPVGKEKWVVQDGTIYGEGITKEYGYLATDRDYKDFNLSLRFKCEADGNSGVYIHTRFAPGTVTVTEGYQVEIDRVLNHHTGGLYGDGKGWFVWPAAENETVIRPYDWNDMLIIVDQNRVISRLNGVTMVDFTNPDPRSTTGVIALQLHSGGEGKMRFKDIAIRELNRK